MNAMQPPMPMPMVTPHHSEGPGWAHKASAFVVLIAASGGFVAMLLWPVVTRLA